MGAPPSERRTPPHRPVAVLLDFDGVIVDSVELKTQAFLDIYAGAAPEALERIRAHQRAHGGVTRRLKFEHFEREIFGRRGDVAAIERLASEYAARVHDAVVTCPFVPGAVDFLEAAHRRTDLHVVSGTPHEELLDVVARRGLTRYFTSVVGAPTTKREAFASILGTHRYTAERVVAVGDATTECEAALSLRIPFIGIVRTDDNPFPDDIEVLGSLERLAERLRVRAAR